MKEIAKIFRDLQIEHRNTWFNMIELKISRHIRSYNNFRIKIKINSVTNKFP